jgi:YgiT-type zinc finger domain-containing protein
MGVRLEDEVAQMSCTICGAKLKPMVSDLPFKIADNTIVILKGLPLLQCANCTEYLLEDDVMSRVDEILANVSVTAELEIIRYAA